MISFNQNHKFNFQLFILMLSIFIPVASQGEDFVNERCVFHPKNQFLEIIKPVLSTQKIIQTHEKKPVDLITCKKSKNKNTWVYQIKDIEIKNKKNSYNNSIYYLLKKEMLKEECSKSITENRVGSFLCVKGDYFSPAASHYDIIDLRNMHFFSATDITTAEDCVNILKSNPIDTKVLCVHYKDNPRSMHWITDIPGEAGINNLRGDCSNDDPNWYKKLTSPLNSCMIKDLPSKMITQEMESYLLFETSENAPSCLQRRKNYLLKALELDKNLDLLTHLKNPIPEELSSKKWEKDQARLIVFNPPDVLYSWMPPERLEIIESQIEENGWANTSSPTIFTSWSPIASFGYGPISVRFKLKPNIQFKEVGMTNGCEALTAEQKMTTVFYRGGYFVTAHPGINTEFYFCSPAVLESFSYQTPEQFEETLTDLEWRLSHTEGETLRFTEHGFFGTIFQLKYDSHLKADFSKEALQKRLTDMKKQAVAGKGKIYYAPGVPQDPVRHFSTKRTTYFNVNESVSK